MNNKLSYPISFNAGTFAPKKSDAVTTEYPDEFTVIRRFRVGGKEGNIVASIKTIVDNQGREVSTELVNEKDQ